MSISRIPLALGMMLLSTVTEYAEEMIISDGDSLRIDGQRIRLWGIDAPEIGQKCRKPRVTYDCGITAREVLIGLIGDKPVECARIDTDRYDRTVVRCTAGGKDLGSRMVSEG